MMQLSTVFSAKPTPKFKVRDFVYRKDDPLERQKMIFALTPDNPAGEYLLNDMTHAKENEIVEYDGRTRDVD